MTHTTITCGMLSDEAAETIAQALLDDGEQDAAHALIREYGESVIMADDGNAEVEMDSDTLAEAAQEYVDGGDWGDPQLTTSWITVYAWRRWTLGDLVVDDPRESHMVALEPDEPECTHDDGHDWQSPHEIVGGNRENPGVQCHGGGIISIEVCLHCGCARTTDTWAQDRDSGIQGLTSVTYEPRLYSEEVDEQAD